MSNLIVKSPAFEHNTSIPRKYSCDGEAVNPPLTITGAPATAKTLALIVDDPDAPGGTFDHWIVWNLPIEGKIEEGSMPGIEGLNSEDQEGYYPMCPPSGTHRYFFKAYALDTTLSLKPTAHKKDLEKAMQGHILSKGELVGLYKR